MAYGGLQELHRKFLEYLRTTEIALDPYPHTYQWILEKEKMTSTDTPRTNGNGKKTKPEPTPPSTEQLAVESAARSFAKLQTDRDEMDRKLTTALQMCAVNRIEIEALKAEKEIAVSRIASYQGERDDAVANLAVYQSLFLSLGAQLRTFGIENAPLIRQTKNEANSETPKAIG